jgi:CRISPR-associated protein Cmr1
MLMKIRLKTLTPLWTGGVEAGKVDRVHETGIIGSLRWWYEAIVRGLGGWACDPTEHGCREEQRCAACELFGATGWSRQFRLRATGNQRLSPEFPKLKVDRDQRGAWWLGAGVLSDDLTLTALPMRPTRREEVKGLAFLVDFMARRAALGARIQVGYGVVGVETISIEDKTLSSADVANTLSAIKGVADAHPLTGRVDERLPDIRDFFFARLTPRKRFIQGAVWWWSQLIRGGDYKQAYEEAKQQGFIPSAPAVRYKMRSWLRDRAFVPGVTRLNDLRHDLMGTTRDSPTLEAPRGSRLFVSHLYQTKKGWEFRVWGWVPDLSAYGVKRDTLLEAIREGLEGTRFAKDVFGLDQSLEVKWHSFDRNGSQSVVDYLIGLM